MTRATFASPADDGIAVTQLPVPGSSDGLSATSESMGRLAAEAAKRRLAALFTTGGSGFRDLAVAHVTSTAGDALVTIALAGTLFFSVPSAEARGNTVLYLLLTVAPFAVVGPLLGRILDRAPSANRAALIGSAAARAALAVVGVFVIDGFWLFPVAFGLLVLSRMHGIARNALLPTALDDSQALVAANSRLATISVLGGVVAAPVGVALSLAVGGRGPLVLSVLAFVVASLGGRRIPSLSTPETISGTRTRRCRSTAAERGQRPSGAETISGTRSRVKLPRPVRLAQVATAVVRLLNGFLLLLLGFAFKDIGGGALDLGAVIAAGGAGFFVASLTSPVMARRLREEPMVVTGLAIEAAAAFLTAQWFSLATAAALAAAAGFAWGTAKLAFDGMLQRAVPPEARGSSFTRSETLFQLAWVVGAVIPVGLPITPAVGLATTGVIALAAQTLYVARLIEP